MQKEGVPPAASVPPRDEPDGTALPSRQIHHFVGVPPRGKLTYSTNLLKNAVTELSQPHAYENWNDAGTRVAPHTNAMQIQEASWGS